MPSIKSKPFYISEWIEELKKRWGPIREEVCELKAESRFLFEASWEVCNKVGGIYTVVKSKAALMKEKYENYFLVGPYIKEKAEVEFEEQEVPHFLQETFH